MISRRGFASRMGTNRCEAADHSRGAEVRDRLKRRALGIGRELRDGNGRGALAVELCEASVIDPLI